MRILQERRPLVNISINNHLKDMTETNPMWNIRWTWTPWGLDTNFSGPKWVPLDVFRQLKLITNYVAVKKKRCLPLLQTSPFGACVRDNLINYHGLNTNHSQHRDHVGATELKWRTPSSVWWRLSEWGHGIRWWGTPTDRIKSLGFRTLLSIGTWQIELRQLVLTKKKENCSMNKKNITVARQCYTS